MGKSEVEKENIYLNLDAKNKEEVIKELSTLLFEGGYISDVDIFIESVWDRENQITTGIGNGVAIPHGKSSVVEQPVIAMATLKKPINWSSLDGELVTLVFLLAVSEENQGGEHLKILANLSSKLMNDDFVDNVKQADTLDSIYRNVNQEV